MVQHSCSLQVSELVTLKLVLNITDDPFLSQLLHDRLVLTPFSHQDRHVRVLALQLVLISSFLFSYLHAYIGTDALPFVKVRKFRL